MCSLDSRMRKLAKEGKVTEKAQAQPITVSEEDRLWEIGALGSDTPDKLLHTLVFYLGVHFG